MNGNTYQTEEYGAVIVAAGMSTRMKRFKQLMKIGGMSFAERVVSNFLHAGVHNIVMVTGYKAEQLESMLRDFPVQFVRNPAFEQSQMFDSVKLGLRALKDTCSRVFFCPVDVPFFTEDTVRREMQAKEGLIVPVHGGRDGHPLLIDSSLIPALLAYEGEGGLKGAYESLPEGCVRRITVPDEGAVIDADTKADFEKLVDLHNRRLLHTEAQIAFASTSPFFDAGTMRLLEQIDACGSVREACEQCGISYSKGWKVLGSCESRLGFIVVERRQGGQGGGAASLSEKGRLLVAAYQDIQREVDALSDDVFHRVMKEYGLL